MVGSSSSRSSGCSSSSRQSATRRRSPPDSFVDLRVVRRTAQCVHRQIDLGVEIPEPLRLDLVLELGHLVGGFVGIIERELVVTVDNRFLRRHPLHDVLANRFCRIELRLLRQSSRRGRLRRPTPRRKFVVEPGHDAKQRRLAGAIDAEHADLGIGIK